MQIPVFVSCPITLNPQQQASRNLIMGELELFGLQSRAVGRSDYPVDAPLREVVVLAKRCAGGIILGFEQFLADSGTWKRGTAQARSETSAVAMPTPWNQIEAGILVGLGLPLLVFREATISGGIFDVGTLDTFIHQMPDGECCGAENRQALREVFSRWQARVRRVYYGD